jgi:hypothetical protein
MHNKIRTPFGAASLALAACSIVTNAHAHTTTLG